ICYGGPHGYLLSDCVFPRPSFSQAERERAEKRLGDMDVAVNAVLTSNQAMLSVLRRLGLRPDAIVGHSTGEFSAIRAAGIIDPEDEESLADFVHELKRNHDEVLSRDGVPRALMLAVAADRAKVEDIAREVGGELYVAMDNCPHQAVLVGDREDVERALEVVRREGLVYQRLSIDRAYHTPGFAPYTDHLREIFSRTDPRPPRVPIYSSTTAALYPSDPDAVRKLVVDHWIEPVEFRRTVEAMYADGVRLFVEVGPKGNLTSFVEDILRGRPFWAAAADMQRRSGITQLNHLVAGLAAQGVSFDPTYLYARRDCRPIDWEEAGSAKASEPVLRVPLSTGFPMLRLPEEVAQTFRRKLEPASPAGNHVEPAVSRPEPPVAPAPAPAELPAVRPPVSAPAAAGAGMDGAMSTYLNTMKQFLEVQGQVMQAFLGGSPGVSAQAPFEGAAPPQMAAPPPAAPISGEATPAPSGSQGNGSAPDAPQHTPLPAAGEDHAGGLQALVAKQLLAIVSERTGYPEDMLDWQLDLEADLGIDSIKRVEILGSYRQRFGAVEAVELEQLTSLRTLRQIIDVLSQTPAAPEPSTDRAVIQLPDYPLLGEVTETAGGLTAERTFDLDQDLYLRDHTLGRAISASDPDLTALAIMPLTMSLEIAAEAAARLVPGKQVVGLRDVRAYRWMTWEDKPVRLRVQARRLAEAPDRVAVELRNLTEDAEPRTPLKSPVLEAVVLLADGYPSPGAGRDVPEGLHPSTWQLRDLYGSGMFHGPSWQGVAAVEASGERGSQARLVGLPVDRFFKDQPSPRFVIDPVVLDAAGQVIGFWTMERLETGQIIFPFHVDAIDLYGPPLLPGEELSCRAAVQLVGEQMVRSDLDLVSPSGMLWARITGWEDKRFELPAAFEPLMLSGSESLVSEAWPDEELPIPGAVCRRAPARFPSDRALWTRVWAWRILSRDERREFDALGLSDDARLEWLAARAAAKDAVTAILREQRGWLILPADVEIACDATGQGQAVVRSPEAVRFTVSLARGGGWGYALVAPATEIGGSEPLRIEVEALDGIDPPAQQYSRADGCSQVFTAVADGLAVAIVAGAQVPRTAAPA
ncbi:MAG TPA: acyltransferase domain-containing protein, partial [Chloroflexota bacterium]|nr:acyltransferase domain-containing protein [Chloroflexota bacterium]